MRRRHRLIMSPLEWQMTAAPVPHPVIPVLAERGGTQLKTPRPVLLVDTREQHPFEFTRFEGWFAGVEKRALKLEITPSPDWKMSVSWSEKTCQTWSIPARSTVPHSLIVSGSWRSVRTAC